MRSLRIFFHDESGFVISTELTMVSSALLMAVALGLTSVRNQVVGEFGDFANALGQVRQSFSVSSVRGQSAAISGSHFADTSRSVGDLTAELGPIELYDPMSPLN